MEPVLQAIKLSKNVGALPVLCEVSLQIDEGVVLGVAGESGAGKSVLARVVAGRILKYPFSSSASLADRTIVIYPPVKDDCTQASD